MRNNLEQPLVTLIKALPLHAEEGDVRETVDQTELQERLLQSGCSSPEWLIAWVRRLFEAWCLLNPHELAQGRWAFVSFPARLVGRSLLETLATPGQTLFEAHYWQQGSHRPESVVAEQRRILMELELRRERHHPTRTARPIRTVHVAWALVRIGNRFLLRHREDRSQPEGRNYVLPGGRLNLPDLPPDCPPVDALRELMQIDSDLARTAMAQTLARELEEELGLLPASYGVTYWRALGPFTMVEGARNHQALTSYQMVLFTLQLSPAGVFQN